MVEDPADRSDATVGTAQIARAEHHDPLQLLILKPQGLKWDQILRQRVPEIEALQQAPRGVGEGIGATARQDLLLAQGILKDHRAPALRQPEGKKRSSRSCPGDRHLQERVLGAADVGEGLGDQGKGQGLQ